MAARGHASDPNDAPWALIERRIPPARPGSRPRRVDIRAIVNAILHFSGLAAGGGSRRRASRPGYRLVVLSTLLAPGRRLGPPPPCPLPPGPRQGGPGSRAGCRHHGWAVGEDDGEGGVRGFDGHRRAKGRKRHILVGTSGSSIASRVEPAGMSDRRAGARLVAGLSPLRPTSAPSSPTPVTGAASSSPRSSATKAGASWSSSAASRPSRSSA